MLFLLFVANLKSRKCVSVQGCCRSRLKGFNIHGYPGNASLYQDARNSYLQDVIEVTIPDEYRNTKFSNITISVPPHFGTPDDGKSYLTLCEVEVFLGTCLAIHRGGSSSGGGGGGGGVGGGGGEGGML